MLFDCVAIDHQVSGMIWEGNWEAFLQQNALNLSWRIVSTEWASANTILNIIYARVELLNLSDTECSSTKNPTWCTKTVFRVRRSRGERGARCILDRASSYENGFQQELDA